MPLINEDGFAVDTICMLDQKEHHLSEQQIAALKSLAKQVVDKIELKNKIARLEATNDDLRNSNILLQKFVSMAAHDIKNPLTSILLTSQLLRTGAEKTGDARSLKLIDVNISSTKSLLSLVEEILAYSRAPGMLLARKKTFIMRALLSG